MQELQIFNSDHFGQLRTFWKSGVCWFVAADVCTCLSIKNSRDAVRRLETDEKGAVLISTPGGKQTVTAVNEEGLYALVLSSRKREAKEFKRWITHDVIPAIRKTGSYSVLPQEQQLAISPKDLKALAKAVAKELQDQELKALPQPKKYCIYTTEIDTYKRHFMEAVVKDMEQLDQEKCSVVHTFVQTLAGSLKSAAFKIAGYLNS